MSSGKGGIRILLLALPAIAVEIPSIAPQVSSVYPHGAQLGTEVEVEFRGSHLDGAKDIRFVHPGLSAEILSSSFRSVRAKVRVGSEVEAGRHDLRLTTSRGTWLGVFQIGTLNERSETEPNNSPAGAEQIRTPGIINGMADGADADHFRFHAEAGQTFVFDVNAMRSGSALDPVLTILDQRGMQMEYCDDYYSSRDARLAHTFKEAGEYIIRVSASFERSAPGAEYRLLISDGPYAAYSLPLGGTRGSSVDVRVSGWNLDSVDRAWLGTSSAKTVILARSGSEATLRLTIPRTMTPGTYQLHLAAGNREIPQPLRFVVSDSSEVSVTDAHAGDAAKPFPIRPAVIVNGEIGTKKNYLERSHTLEFDATGGQRYEFLVESWTLGMRLDPVVTLFDAEGNVLAQEDDPAPNSFIHHPASHDPCLVYAFPKTGRYRVQIRDAAYQGGDGAFYRLTIREAQPSFQVEVRTPQVTLYTGRSASLLSVVQRTGGVHRVERFKRADSEIENFRIVEADGWNEPVSVWIDGLPPGISSERIAAEPSNTTFKGNDSEDLFVNGTVVEIPLSAAADAKAGLYEIRVRAHGSFRGRTVEREGRVLYGSRGMRAEVTQDQKLWLNVVEAPPVLMSPPASFTLTKGKPARMKVPIFRFVEGETPIVIEAKSAPAGLELKPATVPAGAAEADLPLTATDSGQPGQIILVAKTAVEGREVRVESPPVELKVQP
jgi:hypothetical protein